MRAICGKLTFLSVSRDENQSVLFWESTGRELLPVFPVRALSGVALVFATVFDSLAPTYPVIAGSFWTLHSSLFPMM